MAQRRHHGCSKLILGHAHFMYLQQDNEQNDNTTKFYAKQVLLDHFRELAMTKLE